MLGVERGEAHSSCTEVVGVIGGLSFIVDLCCSLCGTPLGIALASFLLPGSNILHVMANLGCQEWHIPERTLRWGIAFIRMTSGHVGGRVGANLHTHFLPDQHLAVHPQSPCSCPQIKGKSPRLQRAVAKVYITEKFFTDYQNIPQSWPRLRVKPRFWYEFCLML